MSGSAAGWQGTVEQVCHQVASMIIRRGAGPRRLDGAAGMLSNVHLLHLGLPVRDAQRSRMFYEQYFGFDPDLAQHCDDGTLIIRNLDGFDLALHPGGRVGPLPAFLHFGFRFDDPDQVRSLLACLRGDDVPIIEEHEESAYLAFKCLDPDGSSGGGILGACQVSLTP